MAWIKVVAGRHKSDYRYSVGVVYNNFPCPKLSDQDIKRLDNTASNLLAEREKEVQGQTFERIYSPEYIPTPSYKRAIKENDNAVFEAYASMGITPTMSDEEIALILLRESIKIYKMQAKKKQIKKKRKSKTTK